MRTCQEGWLVGRSMSAGKCQQCRLFTEGRGTLGILIDSHIPVYKGVSNDASCCAVRAGPSLGAHPLQGSRASSAMQVSQSSCPGHAARARRHGLGQGRPVSGEEELILSTPGSPGGPKADLPVTWQLRGGFHPQTGRQLAFQVGLV